MNHLMMKQMADLDRLDHVALPVQDLDRAVSWYRARFRCQELYRDESWALLEFANTRVAFVMAEEHPPHLGFVHPHAEEFGELLEHRDGTRATYIQDSEGNTVELLDEGSVLGDEEI